MSVPILINDTMRDWMMGTQSLSPVSGFVVVPNLPKVSYPYLHPARRAYRSMKSLNKSMDEIWPVSSSPHQQTALAVKPEKSPPSPSSRKLGFPMTLRFSHHGKEVSPASTHRLATRLTIAKQKSAYRCDCTQEDRLGTALGAIDADGAEVRGQRGQNCEIPSQIYSPFTQAHRGRLCVVVCEQW